MIRMNILVTLALFLLPLTWIVCVATADDTAGAGAVEGRRIGAYEARWSQKMLQDGEWAEIGRIEEKATLSRHDGTEVLEHSQTLDWQGQPRTVNTMIFDRASLLPRRLERKIVDGPPEAPTSIVYSFGDREIKGEALIAEETKSFAIETPGPMFDGLTFGLVLAALPLKDGFVAELPATMPQMRANYSVRAEVVGKERITTPGGGSVEAWVVATAWKDLASGEVSPGGADASGGAYFVVPNPPKGMPYVPMYVNESLKIELIQ